MAKRFACPSCGAGLDYDGGEPLVRCAYCGSNVPVPAELRPTPPAAGAALSGEEAAQLVREQIGMVSQQTQRAGRTVSTVIIVAVAGLMILIGSVCVLLLLTPGS